MDEVTVDAMRERLGVEEAMYESGLQAMSLDVIESLLKALARQI